MINSFEDLVVHVESSCVFKRNAHLLESVGKSLNTNTDRSVAHVRVFSFLDGVVVPIDHTIQVFSDPLGHFVKRLVVELPRLVARKLSQTDRSKIAHSYFVLARVLNNFSAEVGTLDCAEILLVRLRVAVIFVEHVGCTSFNLRIDDLIPKPLSLDCLAASTFFLVASVQLLKLLAPTLEEAWALIRTHKSPIAVRFYSLHEKVWNPQSVEEISSSIFFRAIIFT